MEIRVHEGSCHCGRVRFEADAPIDRDVTQCNCSICRKSGYLHLIVPSRSFRLIAGQEYLTAYSFNTETAKHLFCRICGIKSFYIPRSHPDCFSVNMRCLDQGTFTPASVTQFNGREWEASFSAGQLSDERVKPDQDS